MKDTRLYNSTWESECRADHVDEERRGDQIAVVQNGEADENPAIDVNRGAYIETETERIAKGYTGPLLLLWMILTVAGILSFVFTSSIFSRVNPTNCNLNLYRQSSSLIAQSHNASSWYFKDWGLISGQGFCPLENYKTRKSNKKGSKSKVYQNCFTWSSSVWKNWDTDNKSNGLGETNFRNGANIWKRSYAVAIAFGVWMFLSVYIIKFLSYSLKDYLFLLVPLIPLSVLFWLFLFGLLLRTDQLDPAALQKNIFPSCNVSINRLYDGAIYGICIIILGGVNLLAYIFFICWYFCSEIHESSVYHPGFDREYTEEVAGVDTRGPLTRGRSLRHLHTSHVKHLNCTIDFFLDQILKTLSSKGRR